MPHLHPTARQTTPRITLRDLLYARPLKISSFYDKAVDAAYFSAGAALAIGTGSILTLTFRMGALLTTVPTAVAAGLGLVAAVVAKEYLKLPREARSLRGLIEKIDRTAPQNAPEFFHPRLEALRPELEQHLAAHGKPHRIKFIRSTDLMGKQGISGQGVLKLPSGETVIGISVMENAFKLFTQPELRAVLGHELRHVIKGGFVEKSLNVMQGVMTGASVIAGPAWWFTVGVWSSFQLIKSSFARAGEFDADNASGVLTRDPASMMSVVKKVNAGVADNWLQTVFPVHPSSARRARRLDVQARRMEKHGMLENYVDAPVAVPQAALTQPVTPKAVPAAEPWIAPNHMGGYGVKITYGLGEGR